MKRGFAVIYFLKELLSLSEFFFFFFVAVAVFISLFFFFFFKLTSTLSWPTRAAVFSVKHFVQFCINVDKHVGPADGEIGSLRPFLAIILSNNI